MLECLNLSFQVVTAVDLPNLRTLKLTDCAVTGWENLCSSLSVLNNLTLDGTHLVGVQTRSMLSFLASRVRLGLQYLEFRTEEDMDHLWFSDYAASFQNLREFNLFAIVRNLIP